jgi:cytochrome P450
MLMMPQQSVTPCRLALPNSLEGYAPLMREAGQQLVERLRGLQQQGEEVDISTEVSKMALEVVGTCAFG